MNTSRVERCWGGSKEGKTQLMQLCCKFIATERRTNQISRTRQCQFARSGKRGRKISSDINIYIGIYAGYTVYISHTIRKWRKWNKTQRIFIVDFWLRSSCLPARRHGQGVRRMGGQMAPVKLVKQPPGKLLRKRFRKVRARAEPEVTVVAATSWARVNLQQSAAKCLSGKWLQKSTNGKRQKQWKEIPPTLPLPTLLSPGNAFVFNEFLSALAGAIFRHGKIVVSCAKSETIVQTQQLGTVWGTTASQLQQQLRQQTCSV